MGILSALVTLVPLLLKLFDLFRKSPKDLKDDIAKKVNDSLVKIHDAVKLAKEKGDTSALEKLIRG